MQAFWDVTLSLWRVVLIIDVVVAVVVVVTTWKPFGKRPAGRPNKRWIEGILKDMEGEELEGVDWK
jgi:hypothetical protein